MSPSATALKSSEFRPEALFAKRLDSEDSLRIFRSRFYIPRHPGGKVLYFCGNSLGLQPKSVRQAVEQELEDWAALGVKAHFEAKSPWFPYLASFRQSSARLVGAQPEEVVMMNSMTVNLHLMLSSFYRPEGQRRKVLMEEPTFPSNLYTVRSHLRLLGLDPAECLQFVRPREGEHTIRMEDIESVLERDGSEIALVLFSGVHFYTGQVFDLRRVTRAARERGCRVGWDLAHAAGNIPLSLHRWDIDFAIWCSYKYLNAGPGGVGGCFIHERHGRDARIPRLAGWWGNAPEKRFAPKTDPEYTPVEGAEGWQISNPSILAMAPLKASLEMFEEAGMEALRKKSVRLTGYLQFLLDLFPKGRWTVLTPRRPEERGCQISLRLKKDPAQLFKALESQGVICDFRTPDILRVAPVPLYNSFEDVWRFADILRNTLKG